MRHAAARRRAARQSSSRLLHRQPLSPERPLRRVAAEVARPSRYRLTVNVLPMLVPAAVVTLTWSLPNLAFAGTLHLI